MKKRRNTGYAPRGASLAIRLALHSRPHKSGCRVWIGANDGAWGYGVMRVEGRSIKAHRAAWTNAKGPIPKGLKVLHRCDRPSCIKVSHLFLGTDKDNSDDMIAKGRAFHPGNQGSRHPLAKLTEADIPIIRRAQGYQREIAERFGVSQMIISKVKRGLLWSHVR